MSLADELTKLRDLHGSGALSDSEYANAKARLISEPHNSAPPAERYGSARPAELQPRSDLRKQTNLWAMILHLSQLLGFVIPFGGLVAPIVIWRIRKDDLPDIDAHGCNVANWFITAISAAIVLCLLGSPLVLVLAVLFIGFPVIAAIKAFHGEVWRYPLSFQVFSPEEPAVKPVPKRRSHAGAHAGTVNPVRPRSR